MKYTVLKHMHKGPTIWTLLEDTIKNITIIADEKEYSQKMFKQHLYKHYILLDGHLIEFFYDKCALKKIILS